jgi:hypothetical protein
LPRQARDSTTSMPYLLGRVCTCREEDRRQLRAPAFHRHYTGAVRGDPQRHRLRKPKTHVVGSSPPSVTSVMIFAPSVSWKTIKYSIEGVISSCFIRRRMCEMQKRRPFLGEKDNAPCGRVSRGRAATPRTHRNLAAQRPQPASVHPAENGIFEPFIYKNDHFAKTGSGQT